MKIAQNKAFGHPQSFVAGPPKNGVQFMVKDSKKYATTGGWGFAQFDEDGKLAPTQSSKPTFPATRLSKIATWSSPVTNRMTESGKGRKRRDGKMAVMKMKAAQVPKAGADFEVVEREIPQPSSGTLGSAFWHVGSVIAM